MSARKIRASWWIDFRFEHRRYRLKSPDNTRVGAQAYEATVRAALARGDRRVLERGRRDDATAVVTFAEFAERWLDTYVRANNKPTECDTKRKILRCHLLPAFGASRLDAITARRIETLKAEKLSSGLAPKTVNNILTVLSSSLRCAVEWQVLAAAPKIRLLRVGPQRFDYLRPDEVAAMLADGSEPRWADLVRFALRTGLRLGELRALRWEDVDMADRTIVVRRSRTRNYETSPKNHRERVVPLAPDVAALLERRVSRSGYVFASSVGTPLGETRMHRALERLCARVGLRRIGWHALRHTFATELVRRCAPLPVVKELLGHATIEMTMRYAHVAPSSLRDAIGLLPWAEHGQPAGNGAMECPAPTGAEPCPRNRSTAWPQLNETKNSALASQQEHCSSWSG